MRLLTKIRNSKFHSDNRGSAMIVAIVVSIIVIAFTLSLLLVSYSLFTSTAKRVTQSQVKELAKSISFEIGDELTNPKFNTKDELLAGINDDSSVIYRSSEYNLWYYIRYNVCQNEGWVSYVDETTAGHIAANAFRYFSVDIYGDSTKYAAMADDIYICMYWANDDISDKNETVLTVEVTVTKGEQTYTLTSYYELAVYPFDEEHTTDSTMNEYFNPNGRYIDLSENWVWTKIN